jgi:hypothetical protein
MKLQKHALKNYNDLTLFCVFHVLGEVGAHPFKACLPHGLWLSHQTCLTRFMWSYFFSILVTSDPKI